MDPEYLRLGMDSFLLFFLVLTVYFAFRLSKNLREFRSYRSELEKIMHTLATQLERAQSVIHDIKEISKASGQDIDMLVADSRMAVEDLRAVNEVSEALANRLERLARAHSGRSSEPLETPRNTEDESIQGILDDLKQELSTESDMPKDIPSFLTSPSSGAQKAAAPAPKKKLKSAAEQDLYEALLKKNKTK